ncbi:MAG: hypothetical protein WCW67_05180 [Candidatus Margulisiibacteriota bacterium]
MKKIATLIMIAGLLAVPALAELSPKNLTPEGRREMIKVLKSRLYNLEHSLGVKETYTAAERKQEIERINAELEILYALPKIETLAVAALTAEAVATPEVTAAAPTPEPVIAYDPLGGLPKVLKHPVKVASLPAPAKAAWAGQFAFAAGYFANLAAVRGEWGLPVGELNVRGGGLLASGSGTHLALFTDVYYYLNPPETVGMRSYVGAGVNLPLISSAGGGRSLGGGLIYGGETKLADGRLFFEFGLGTLRSGTDRSGLTALVGYRF